MTTISDLFGGDPAEAMRAGGGVFRLFVAIAGGEPRELTVAAATIATDRRFIAPDNARSARDHIMIGGRLVVTLTVIGVNGVGLSDAERAAIDNLARKGEPPIIEGEAVREFVRDEDGRAIEIALAGDGGGGRGGGDARVMDAEGRPRDDAEPDPDRKRDEIANGDRPAPPGYPGRVGVPADRLPDIYSLDMLSPAEVRRYKLARAELGRELALRRVVYPGFIARKKLDAETAEKQMARLRSALATVQAVPAAVHWLREACVLLMPLDVRDRILNALAALEREEPEERK